MAQKVERQHADAEPPPVTFWQHGFIYLLAVPGDKAVEVITQGLIELSVVDNQVGLQIQRQTQRVEIT